MEPTKCNFCQAEIRPSCSCIQCGAPYCEACASRNMQEVIGGAILCNTHLDGAAISSSDVLDASFVLAHPSSPNVNLHPLVQHHRLKWLKREDEVMALHEALISADENHGGVVGLIGMGGGGKTVMCTMLACHTLVSQLYTDGIYWINAGRVLSCSGKWKFMIQELRTSQEAHSQLSQQFGDKRVFPNQAQWQQHLTTLLRGKRLLIIIDDVWDPAIVQALQVNSRVLSMLSYPLSFPQH